MPRTISARSATPQELDRSWQTAVQNINGMISILTLLPVLTGRAQNVKLVASRLLPGSFIVTGIGAGRVLMKLQTGILLCSFDLYRNVIGDISYPHDEYVNKFSPKLDHIPTGTPERHATAAYINHNPAEVYMVEAWFRSQGRPTIVKLRLNNQIRVAVGFAIYLCLYAGETFLAMHNAATGCKTVFLALQGVSVLLWLAATTVIQIRKGEGKKEVELNDTQSSEYRCFRVSLLGNNVSSALLSFNLNNLDGYRVFQAEYNQGSLVFAGVLVLISGLIDMLSTVLIVGLTFWAYPWLAVELLIILAKVIFCIEPVRYTEIAHVKLFSSQEIPQLPQNTALEIPLHIHTDKRWTNISVTTDYNILKDNDTGITWQSTSAGIFIGQHYTAIENGVRTLRHLAFTGQEKKLGLVNDPPELQSNQALQREFLAALCAVVHANKVPSKEFITAVETLMANVRPTMAQIWYSFGTKDLADAVAAAKSTLAWRWL